MKDHEKQLLVKEEVMKQYQENNKAVETKVEFLKGRLETTMRNYQDLDKNTRLEIDALKDELKLANIKSVEDANFDESIKESDSVKKDVHDEVVKDFNLQIEYLRNRGNDIEDELAIKYEEVEVLKETLQQNTLKASMKSTSSSLAEELDHASIELETSKEHIEMNPRPFESVHLLVVCKHCSLTFSTIADLKEHQRKLKQEQMEQKLEKLNQISIIEKELSSQKSNMTDSLFKLKKIETDGRTCKCKKYCRIYHEKHTFIKSMSEEFYSKFKSFSEVDVHSNVAGAIKKRYTCKQCEQQFSKQGDLKKHIKREHKRRED